MRARLLILVAIAVGLAVAFAMKKPVAPPSPATSESEKESDTEILLDSEQDKGRVEEWKKRLADRPLPGEEPKIPPELDIRVEVDTTQGKNRLFFYITEKHGYYVEVFGIDFWYKDAQATGPENSPLPIRHHLEKYLKASETMKDCIEVVSAELAKVGGDIGTSANWDARIHHHGRARDKNPEKLPVLAPMETCR
jgi:hypothetical protein